MSSPSDSVSEDVAYTVSGVTQRKVNIINTEAIEPLSANEITMDEALETQRKVNISRTAKITKQAQCL